MIQDGEHLLTVLRQVEANPQWAGKVTDPADYRRSSYQARGVGRDDPLLSPLAGWEALGRTAAGRRSRWRQKVRSPQPESDAATPVVASPRADRGRKAAESAWSRVRSAR